MKKITLLILLLVSHLALYAQDTVGINFLKDKNWNEALAIAKVQNKLIFVDVYTDWCGPCKTMDVEVFSKKSVGDKFNASFINYKLDAEKGEGPELKKRYAVKSYPNYLFINGDGILIYRATSSMPASEFLSIADNALIEAKQSQTIIQLDALYPIKRKDPSFMYTYLLRKTQLKLSNPDLVDEYINLLNDKERGEIKNLQLILDNGTFLNKSLQLGVAFTTLKKHEDKFQFLKRAYNETIDIIFETAKETSLTKAISQKDETLLQKVLNMSPSFKQNFSQNKHTITLAYYLGIGQKEKYITKAIHYTDNYLLKIPIDSLAKWDQSFYNKKKVSIEKNNGRIEDIEQYKHTQTISLLRQLDEIAKNIASTKAVDHLTAAKNYSDFTLRLADLDPSYYKNVWPMFIQTNAILNYKLGHKQLAIADMEKMIATINQPKATQYFAPLLHKMKTNQEL